MKWHCDGGHGWLEVSKAKLVSLGIAHKVSGYSYQKGTKAYLEEDCDASLFFAAYFKDSEWYKNEEFKKEAQSIPEQVYKGDAPVREYDQYYFKFDEALENIIASDDQGLLRELEVNDSERVTKLLQAQDIIRRVWCSESGERYVKLGKLDKELTKIINSFKE